MLLWVLATLCNLFSEESVVLKTMIVIIQTTCTFQTGFFRRSDRAQTGVEAKSHSFEKALFFFFFLGGGVMKPRMFIKL